MLLAGDIGGTKTVLALFEVDTNSAETPSYQARHEQTFPSANYDSLEAIVSEYIQSHADNIDAAAFGVAGPVVRNRSKITNLNWTIDGEKLAANCDLAAVKLLNDLAATANAIPILPDEDLHTLNDGDAEPEGTIAVIAPGTGLGEAFLSWDSNRYVAHPSEGGHSAFSPSNELELNLLHYLFQKFDRHVSTERVCSGSGIPNIYDYLKDSGHAPEPEWLAEKLAGVEDRTPIIADNALSDSPAQLTRRTLEIFANILASETGDLALTFLATGGVYLGGGIPPRILPFLESAEFHHSFCQKGRFTQMMKGIPVNVITNPKAALLGAARAGYELLK